MTPAHEGFDNLGRAGRAAAALGVRPKPVVYAALATGVGLAWLLLAAIAIDDAARAGPGAAGPGRELLSLLPALPLPPLLADFAAYCLTAGSGPGTSLAGFAALAAMWMAMAVATMTPSAAPLLRTYCEIADTAATKREAAVHPMVLVAGYLAVWAAASLGFAGLTLTVQALAGAASPTAPVAGVSAATALGLAGLYQFSGFKEACLTKCRNPFSTLFARWSTRPAAIFRLGVEQGLWCVGCCWALMLVMFAVGVMNLFWMALIAVFTTVEKQFGGRLAPRLAGGFLLVWAAALLVTSV